MWRWVYVAETDAAAKRDTEAGIIHHLSHFMSAATSGYLGTVSEKHGMDTLTYDTLAVTTLVHGSPETVIARLRALRDQTRWMASAVASTVASTSAASTALRPSFLPGPGCCASVDDVATMLTTECHARA